jgi:flagellar export protein FliJ
MAFRFSLETLLRLRISQERAERMKLKAVISEQSLARTRLQEISEGSAFLYRDFQERLRSGMAGAELQLEIEREANVKSACKDLGARIAEIEQRRVTQLQSFRQARRNRESIENLRLRQLELYRVEQGRREQRDLDDLFLMRHESEDTE